MGSQERCSTQWGPTLHSEVQQENLGKSTRVLPSLTADLQNPKQLHNPCWTPPPHGWIKVNSDAATATSSTAIAAVARNSTGMVVMVNSHVVVQNTSLEGWSQAKRCRPTVVFYAEKELK
nr:hypothetical protein CFP56_43390 [Quercus suber]